MTENITPPIPARRDLPVLKAFAHMLSIVKSHWQKLLRPALPWLALLALIDVISFKLQGPKIQTPSKIEFDWFDLVSIALGLVAASSIAVSWHRYILIDAPLSAEPFFRLDKIVFSYLARSFVIYGLCLIPLVALAIIISLVAPILLPFIAALFLQLAVFVCRMSISLPAIAIVRDKFGLKNAMEVSRGNNLRILGLLFLTYVILAMILLLYITIIAVISAIQPSLTLPTALVLSMPIQFCSIILNASLLTSLYGYFVERRDF